MFDKCKLVAKDINKIIVVDGPGSFTGIRIGITIAKIFAWSLNIPIITITSLEAMAISNESDNVLVPIIDARRGYVYSAIYEKGIEKLNPQHIKIVDLYDKLNKYDKYIYITNDNLDLNPEKCFYDPDILKIVAKFGDKTPVNPHNVNPNYLKLTAAEESRM